MEDVDIWKLSDIVVGGSSGDRTLQGLVHSQTRRGEHYINRNDRPKLHDGDVIYTRSISTRKWCKFEHFGVHGGATHPTGLL